MAERLRGWLYSNWVRKVVAVLSALVIWFYVNHTILISKSFVNVPVRVVNLPQDMTVEGLMPHGIMTKRMTLNLTGHRHVLEELESTDLEVRIDGSDRVKPWIAQVGKKNIVSVDESINLSQHLTKVEHSEILLKPSRLITAKVPVRIPYPSGEPPTGYQYLDVWPTQLGHTISGPEHQVEELQEKGLVLRFDLSLITKDELDRAEVSNPEHFGDEVRIPFPMKWKRVSIPFHNNAAEELNDPEAKNLHIDFLRKEILPLGKKIPVRVYFPIKHIETLNPDNYGLVENSLITEQNGVFVLNMPLFVNGVSRLFLDIVSDHLEISIIAAPKGEQELLSWSVEFHNIQELENEYVERLMESRGEEGAKERRMRMEFLRNRFRDYIRGFALLKEDETRLNLDVRVYGKQIEVTEHGQEGRSSQE